MTRARLWRVLLPLFCALLLVGILSAGLWPFHAPGNAIRWLSGGALSLGEYGSLVTRAALKPSDSPDSPFTLEVWVKRGAADNDGTILAFFGADKSAVSFAVRQSLGDLELWHGPLTRRPPIGTRVYVDDVFGSPGWMFFTVTSGPAGTKVYSNGVLLRDYPDYKLSGRDFTGRIMIGNAPGLVDTWTGEIRAVAVYSREFTAREVVNNYRRWSQGDTNGLSGKHDILAVYRFNEGAGNWVHNQIDTVTDLYIPERFFVLNKPFLEAPWEEFYLGWGYWANLILNVVAFVPLGFAFCALFSSTHAIERRLLAAISVGFAVSLIIEVLQAVLPTRKSGVTDLFTNTFGTALGAMSYRYMAPHGFGARIAHFFLASERAKQRDGGRSPF